MPATWVPILYAVAMGADGIAALTLGPLFDRIGLHVMLGTTLVSALIVWGERGGRDAALGVGMGAQEWIVRAAVAQLAPAERLATAYGIFNAVYGIAWFAGSVLLGVLYDRSIPALVAVAVVFQLAALPILGWLMRPAAGRHLG